MLTVEQAKALTYRTTLYHVTSRNSDGTPLRARVNGAPQTWKTRPNEVRVPMKHGLRNTFQMWHNNLSEWCLTEAEAMRGGR
jgi:hypothetical protein